MSDIRVELPTQPAYSTRPPPTGFPLVLWGLWLAIFAAIYRVRYHGLAALCVWRGHAPRRGGEDPRARNE